LAYENDEACRGAFDSRENASKFWLYWAGSAPCLEGGRLPFRDGAPLEGAKYSDAPATLLRSSLGECTDVESGHEVTPVSGRCWLSSVWPKPKFEKLALSDSTWREEVKFVEVGSSKGFWSLGMGPEPTTELRGPV
jgi:hypothetical protein